MLRSFVTFFSFLSMVALGVVVAPSAQAAASPRLSNYYLGEIKNSPAFLDSLARYDLLILTPTQIKTHPAQIRALEQRNPDIIILAYVPSQSYNSIYWDKSPVYKHLNPIKDSWWLKDPQGRIASPWPGLKHTNMSEGWSRHLVSFVNKQILTLPGVDGVFFDMISNNISWLNKGNIDLDGNGSRDSAAAADHLWKARTTFFLQHARTNLTKDIIVINGSSDPAFQSYVNGRMFENFPTPWEGDGAWSTIMNNWDRIAKQNENDNVVIINSNTDNTNIVRQSDIRFGLTSALMLDGYFSYDFGDQNHAQIWWHDEYNVDLGIPLGAAKAKSGNPSAFNSNVWQREFDRGAAVVNASGKEQRVDLGGEYEKIKGTKDPFVNNGEIISEAVIGADDGLVLLKTFQSLNDVLFTNGSFVRFLRPTGGRVRNGFFAFEETYSGGDQVAHMDLDGNGRRDLLVVSGNKISAWRDDGLKLMKIYPYTANYKGTLRVALGDLNGDSRFEVYVGPGPGYTGPVKVYTRHGRQMKRDWYPFGEGYTGGYSFAVGNPDGARSNQLLIGVGTGVRPEVYVFDKQYNPLRHWLAYESRFRGGVNVAVGDVDGDGVDEVVTGPGEGGKPLIRTFNGLGAQKYPEFSAYGAFGFPGIDVRIVDVDFDGKKDIVGMSESF